MYKVVQQRITEREIEEAPCRLLALFDFAALLDVGLYVEVAEQTDQDDEIDGVQFVNELVGGAGWL